MFPFTLNYKIKLDNSLSKSDWEIVANNLRDKKIEDIELVDQELTFTSFFLFSNINNFDLMAGINKGVIYYKNGTFIYEVYMTTMVLFMLIFAIIIILISDNIYIGLIFPTFAFCVSFIINYFGHKRFFKFLVNEISINQIKNN